MYEEGVVMGKPLRRGTALLLACVLLFALCSCNEKKEKKKEIDVHTLCHKITESVTLPEMLELRDDDKDPAKGFSTICGLDYAKVEAFDLYFAADGTAYEIAVIKLKDEKDIDALKKSLKDHVKQRIDGFRTRMPDEITRAESTVITDNDKYAALVMCDEPERGKAAFDAAFS